MYQLASRLKLAEKYLQSPSKKRKNTKPDLRERENCLSLSSRDFDDFVAQAYTYCILDL